ncbi:MAG: DUF4252 domain-containing protein [Bacteroidaceae bacterium]|nr:DUF4252 domain-containing protein [Bacteroidaceae bacterium]
MKKILMIAIVLAMSTMAMAQSVGEVIDKYKSLDNAESMTLTKDMLSMMTAMAQNSKDLDAEARESMEMMKNIEQMTTLQVKEADAATATTLMSDMRKALSKGYEITTDMQEDNESVVIAIKKKKKKDNHASEVVIVAKEEKETVVVYIIGKIDMDKIGNLMNMTKD